ncbi:hypothetical protein [Ralstonia pickettii]|nr:hypothetical protein [Ralstonia pickettii]NWK44309.1 hypothetical protein [Ralstonia pickettii]
MTLTSLRPTHHAAAERFVDALTPFGIGASWGGYESLATISNVAGHAY